MSAKEIFTERYLTVAEANRRNYAKVARSYVERVRCVVDPQEQQRLKQQIGRAMAVLGDLGRPIVALDACGGAGNAAMQLLKLGCNVTLADISPEMIEIYKESCRDADLPAVAVPTEIGDYLSRHHGVFDLIIFSSALHHLEDPVGVLRLARSSLTKGGIIATLFDPIRQPKFLRAMTVPIHWFMRAKSSPRLVLTRTVPVLKRIITGGDVYKNRKKLEITGDNVGNLAEFYGGRGFDDHALVHNIEQVTGLRVLAHDRSIANCSKLERRLRSFTRHPNQFQLIMQKTEPSEDAAIHAEHDN